MSIKNKDICDFIFVILLGVIIYIIFFNSNIFENFESTNDLNGLDNSYSDNIPNIQSISKFTKQNPGARLFYIRDSANFMLTTNTWVFMYDPYEPSNPYGTYLCNINGSRIFGNNMTYKVKPINLIVGDSQKYTQSFYNLDVFDINGQDLLIDFIVNLIQVQTINPMYTLDNTPISSIKLKPGDLKLSNIQLQEGFESSGIIGSAMATGSTGLDGPEKGSDIVDLDSFLNSFPGAQAWYIYKSFSESILPSNYIVYTYNPVNPLDTNGTRLATGNGRTFFFGEYPLTIEPNQDKQVYGVDVLSNQYTQNINTYIQDGYTLFDTLPYYESTPIDIFKFSILARKVPNGTWIN